MSLSLSLCRIAFCSKFTSARVSSDASACSEASVELIRGVTVSPRAWAAGKLDIYWPQPGPISGWHPATYTVTVRLQDIVTHNGQPSYRKMADFYVNRQGAAKVLHFTFHTLPDGSVPAWNPG